MITLGLLQSVLDISTNIQIVDHDGDGNTINISWKNASDYFEEHSNDIVTFISIGTTKTNKIIIFTEEQQQ